MNKVSLAPTKIPDYMDRRHDWIGFDFDRTLATYHKWGGPGELGEPIAPMVELLKRTHEKTNCKIFSARVWPVIHYDPHTLSYTFDPTSSDSARQAGGIIAVKAITNWCEQHLGFRIPITTVKDIHCLRLYDDIAIQVEPNTGRLIVD